VLDLVYVNKDQLDADLVTSIQVSGSAKEPAYKTVIRTPYVQISEDL
jgi:hypothetical protein